MSSEDARARAEELADAGSFDEALALLREARRGAQRPVAVAVQISEGAVLARSGKLTEAVAVLELAEALAMGLPALSAEARLMRASVLGGLGRYKVAIPLLERAVADLEGLGSELSADARAELQAFKTMLDPTGAVRRSVAD